MACHCRKASFLLASAVLLVLLTASRVATQEQQDGGEERVIVETSLGPIVGLAGVDEDGVDSFKGIQYAVVGDRFSRSTLIDDVVIADGDTAASSIDATSYGPFCYQSMVPGSALVFAGVQEDEECLYLNVWRPSSASNDTSLLPVMVWIHGGGFVFGSGAEPIYNGAKMAGTQNVVVVTINYRLGLFGGLVTGENGEGGANFLEDQINALRWVQDHIESFGGDPNDVTIFGESAGAISVCVLAVSPLAQGLFRRSIQQSGECIFGIIQPNTAEQGANLTQQVLRATGASSISDLGDASSFPPRGHRARFSGRRC